MVMSENAAVCRECGCTDINACVDFLGFPCFWVEPDLCSRCHEENDEPLDLGMCCACRRDAQPARNILFLPKKSPEPGAGCWGCAQCGLAMEGAVAVICDDCASQGKEPVYAFLGPLAQHRYIDVSKLTGQHLHDLWFHPEVPKSLAEFPVNEWMGAADVCQWCKARYQVKIEGLWERISPDGLFAEVVYRVPHNEECPDYSGEEPEEESDFAGWEFAEVKVTLGGRGYPSLASRSNVGPCLRCWRLIVDVPLSLMNDRVQLDFCFSCAQEGGIFDLLKR